MGQGGWACYISLLCSHIILTLLRALRALAKSSFIFRTEKFDITMLVYSKKGKTLKAASHQERIARA